jgi:hypothetical protein
MSVAVEPVDKDSLEERVVLAFLVPTMVPDEPGADYLLIGTSPYGLEVQFRRCNHREYLSTQMSTGDGQGEARKLLNTMVRVSKVVQCLGYREEGPLTVYAENEKLVNLAKAAVQLYTNDQRRYDTSQNLQVLKRHVSQ